FCQRVVDQCRGDEPAMPEEAVDASQTGFVLDARKIIDERRAQIGFAMHKACFCQSRHYAMRGSQELYRTAQRHRRAVFAFDLGSANHNDIAAARYEVDPMTRMQQADGPV